MKQCNGMSLSKIDISLPKKSQNFVTAPRIYFSSVAAQPVHLRRFYQIIVKCFFMCLEKQFHKMQILRNTLKVGRTIDCLRFLYPYSESDFRLYCPCDEGILPVVAA